MKDRMIWCVCGLLFGAGIIWGKMSGSPDFFKIANVHDLFDIAGAFATIVAVIIALVTMNSWRKQAKAESDHELARKLVVVLRKYNDELLKTWHFAESSVIQIENNSWIGDGGSDNYLVKIYQSRLSEIQAVRAEIEPLDLECSEIWGGVFKTQFAELYRLEHVFCDFIDNYVRLLIRGRFDERAEIESTNAMMKWQNLKDNDLGEYKPAEKQINKTVDLLRVAARARLIGFDV
ncbi:hypothetical protein [Pseudomonas sp. GL-R-19]|uniref:hypothetical protein n=1 Tax=Pseudomonas sp. GL-R-19 TaxID=2832391 RepID=UPI001CBFC3F9|nr:hypothetical protein [Pseudomonas sp. GL-R-19]